MKLKFTPIPQRWWVGFHRRFQHVIQNIFRLTSNGRRRITSNGIERITSNSDY